MSEWVLRNVKADFSGVMDRYGISEVTARIIRNRNVCTAEDFRMYLDGSEADLHKGENMTDLVKACSLLLRYIEDGEKIRIIGDYDIDGICSTYILLRGIRACGGDVDYAIPHRIRDGYGLNEQLITEAHEAGRTVIITCDNGIAAYDQIGYANSLGMHVIVTDHHEVPYDEDEETGVRTEILPPAEAVVDPGREGDAYPFRGICGGVVAWKLIGVLFSMSRMEKAEADALMKELMEEAAIATVGDVMELRDENRIIVKKGLDRLEHTENTGLQALIRAVGLEGKKISAYHIGFVIGPCLNATGRLDSASRALELLLCSDPVSAARMSDELKSLNDARKSMTEQGLEKAVEDIENSRLKDDKVLIVYLPDIHESIAGIIAGRLRERYEKPTLVMTDALSEEGEQLIKGSGRSVDAYNMFESLAVHKDMYTKFGGHKMAAGLTMPLDNLDRWRRLINEECGLSEDDLKTKIFIDYELPLGGVTYDLVGELGRLEPFGNGNNKPVLAKRGLTAVSAAVLGRNRNLLIVKVRDTDGRIYELKFFNQTESFMDAVDARYGEGTSGDLCDGSFCAGTSPVKMDVIYYPGINEFRGMRSLEYIVNDYRLK